MLFALLFEVLLHSDQINIHQCLSRFFFHDSLFILSISSIGECCWWVVNFLQAMSFQRQVVSGAVEQGPVLALVNTVCPGLSLLRARTLSAHTHSYTFYHSRLCISACYPGQHSGLLLGLLSSPSYTQLYSSSSQIPVHLDQATDRLPNYPIF